jgi:hypothetical protein
MGRTARSHRTQLHGMCKLFYHRVLFGLAGKFSQRALRELQDCLPADAIASVEHDSTVHSMMDRISEAPPPSALGVHRLRVAAHSPADFRESNESVPVKLARAPFDRYQVCPSPSSHAPAWPKME